MIFVNDNKSELKENDYRLFKETPAWDLAKAVKNADEKKIKELTNHQPALINYQEPKYGNTLLMLTVMNQQFKPFVILLNNHADVDIHNTFDGSSAIIEAVKYQWFDIKFVKTLVSYGANVNDVSTRGNENHSSISALMSAVSSGKKEFVEYLVDKGADVNYRNSDNCFTALTEAMMTDKYEIGYYLLLRGADYIRPLFYRPDYSIPMELQDSNNKGEPIYLANFLRENFFELYTKEYKYKMLIVTFLQHNGVNYWETPVPDYIKEKIQKIHPNNWQDILEKY